MQYETLLRPGKIGSLEIKNRVIKAPLDTHLASRDGSVNSRLLRYFKNVAMGGAGLIIVEYTCVDNKASQGYVCELGIYDDQFIPGLATLAETIKQHRVRAGIQITHAGRQRALGPPLVGPSRVPLEEYFEETRVIPIELKTEEVMEIVEAFGEAAWRAKLAGFELIEIHGAHGYLITSFLSKRTNKRTDWFGGSLENRMRFPLEIAKIVKKRVGKDFPVGMRITADEYEVDGITLDESKEFSKRLEEVGLDFVHVSAGNHHQTDREIEPMYHLPGTKVHLAEAIKKVVKIPVIASGSITSPELAEEILKTGKADFVSLGRPLLADPHFVKKIEEGRPEDITPCIRCMECLERGARAKTIITCTVNVPICRYEEFEIKKAPISKNILIVGGGPAGMEAARVAALRGHRVHLYEKQGVLGGLMREASIPDFKSDLRRLINYYAIQLKKLGITIVNQEATINTITKSKFDAIVLATGSIPTTPGLQGVDKPFVVTPLEALRGKNEEAVDIVVIGGNSVGCEVALYLAEKKKKVTLIEMLENFAYDMDRGSRKVIIERLKSQNVEMYPCLRLTEITDKGIIAVDQYNKKRSFFTDIVVLALGMTPNDEMAKTLKERGIKFYAIGDCVKPRKIYDAIYEGHITAQNL